MNQVLYLVGLHNSTPTIACALTNLLPALTFVLAVPFGWKVWELREKQDKPRFLGQWCVYVWSNVVVIVPWAYSE
ncbi:unnamed protein product [Camellia sinensis]